MQLTLVNVAPRPAPGKTVAAGLEMVEPPIAADARLVVFPELFPFPPFPAVHDKRVMFTDAELFP